MDKVITTLREIAEVLFLTFGLNIVAFKNHSKRPTGPWKKFQTERQTTGEALSFEWHRLTGLGIILGKVGNVHAFDIDQVESLEEAHKLLAIADIGIEYPWIIKSGSGQGFHIYFSSENLLEEFNGKTVLTIEKSPLKCKQIEVRISCLIAAPGSTHKSGGKYAFVNSNNFDRPMVFLESKKIREIVNALDPTFLVKKSKSKKYQSKSRNLDQEGVQQNDPHVLAQVVDCIEQAKEKNIDISFEYERWRDAGFAIANKFGEAGRELFHLFSQLSTKYDAKECDTTFTNYVKSQHQPRTNKKTIRAFFEMYRQIGIKPRVHKRNELVPEEENPFHDALEILLAKYRISRDTFTDTVFVDGVPLDDRHFNNMYVYLRSKYNFKSIRKDDIASMLENDYLDEHHRILDLIKNHTPKNPRGNIKRLRQTLGTNTGASIQVTWHGEVRPFVDVIIEVYLVKMVKGFFETEVNDLVLVLLGDAHLGKSYWILHILPDEISDLCRITQFTMDKDFKMLLTNSAILNIDEIREKDMASNEFMKQVITTSSFPLRVPYGRQNKMRKRVATLAGTGNNTFILRDVTGNRRFVPLWLTSLDRNLFNSICKKDLLSELYGLYKSGYDTSLDNLIDAISSISKDFEVRTEADELLLKYCPPFSPSHPEVSLYSVREMNDLIYERTKRNLNFTQVGLAVDRLGYEGKTVSTTTYNGKISKVWKYYCDPTGTLSYAVKTFEEMLNEPMPLSTLEIGTDITASTTEDPSAKVLTHRIGDDLTNEGSEDNPESATDYLD